MAGTHQKKKTDVSLDQVLRSYGRPRRETWSGLAEFACKIYNSPCSLENELEDGNNCKEAS